MFSRVCQAEPLENQKHWRQCTMNTVALHTGMGNVPNKTESALFKIQYTLQNTVLLTG